MSNLPIEDQTREQMEYLLKNVALHINQVCTIPAGVNPAHIGPQACLLMGETLK